MAIIYTADGKGGFVSSYINDLVLAMETKKPEVKLQEAVEPMKWELRIERGRRRKATAWAQVPVSETGSFLRALKLSDHGFGDELPKKAQQCEGRIKGSFADGDCTLEVGVSSAKFELKGTMLQIALSKKNPHFLKAA